MSYHVGRKILNQLQSVKSREVSMERISRKVIVGIGGWEHEILDQCFYPAAGFDSVRKLSLFAESFDAVEVRPTFWDDTIGQKDAAEWVSAVSANPRFRFSVKLHQSLTHRKELTPGTTRRMRSVLHELSRSGRLGAVLAQFPYSFTNTGANRFHLTRLGEVFSGFPVFAELRHDSWDTPALAEVMRDRQLLPVSVDFPRLRQYLSYRSETGGTTAYLRLHGRNEKGWLVNAVDSRYDYLYNGREVREIKRRIDRLLEKAETIYVVFNNTTGGKAIANAFQLSHLLRAGERLPVLPRAAADAFPFLRTIAGEESGQTELLMGRELRRAI